jgi:hypothetical protein
MYKLGYIFCFLVLFACKSKRSKTGTAEPGFTYEAFSDLFPAIKLPYQITDTALLRSKDTTQIRSSEFAGFIADSVKNQIFTKGSKPKYYALAKIEVPKAETYYIVKAVSGSKKAALLISFDRQGKYATSFPFLVPDDDATTSQLSSIDKSFTISKNIVQKKDGELKGEGKNVYVYSADTRQFILIMTDLLDESKRDLINPIDTMPKTRKFAGDYIQGKRSLVSIRNGRTPNQALAFIHIEKNDGECVGELKGEILFTSSTTAIYRQGGDPCILQFNFTSSSVTLKEEEGCGNHRGLDCTLNGNYTKKKEAKSKSNTKKTTKK